MLFMSDPCPWYASKCLTTRSPGGKAPICNVHQFLCCQYYHHGWFQATHLALLNAELGRGGHGLSMWVSRSWLPTWISATWGQRLIDFFNLFYSLFFSQQFEQFDEWMNEWMNEFSHSNIFLKIDHMPNTMLVIWAGGLNRTSTAFKWQGK